MYRDLFLAAHFLGQSANYQRILTHAKNIQDSYKNNPQQAQNNPAPNSSRQISDEDVGKFGAFILGGIFVALEQSGKLLLPRANVSL